MVMGKKVLCLLLLAGCNVPAAPKSTGGITPDAGAVCPMALSILCGDFMSTNIEIAGLDGTALSGSFVSSGSTLPGLSLALSGDVDIPFVAPASGRVVLIDRYGTNVLTWMDLSSGKVLQQLAIGTGFQANPQDYIEVDATRAFVSRYTTNPSPGQQMYDQGGDVLVVDTQSYAITGRIAMPEENAALNPSPSGTNWIGSDVVVTLQRFSTDFSMVGDGRFVGVSPASNAIAWTVDISGLQNCGRVYVSPSGNVGAIACAGAPNAAGTGFTPSGADIVLYDLTQSPPVETKRLGLGTTLNASIQPSLAFASETSIFALTYGGTGSAGDTVFAVDTGTAAVTPLASETVPDAYGAVHCSPGCGDVCVVSDAQANALVRWQFANGTYTPLSNVQVDPTVGLPPRNIGNLL
ncbi:MAG: hypothetical protein FWD17_17515 [Polyangiaceae bacterium]|nr:hypothetical protein [Polyangiaceae bacterium]